jgi:hypothetical protein
MARAIDGQGASSQSGAYVKFAFLRSAFDALGPAHQSAKHGHDKQSQDYYKENFTERALHQRCRYLDHSLSLGPPAVNKKKAPAKPGASSQSGLTTVLPRFKSGRALNGFRPTQVATGRIVPLTGLLSLLDLVVVAEIEPLQTSILTTDLKIGRMAVVSRYDVVGDFADLGVEGTVEGAAQVGLPLERCLRHWGVSSRPI